MQVSTLLHISYPVESVVEGESQDVGGVDAPQDREKEEADKVAVVQVTHAGVDPGTVVVHLHHAATTWEGIGSCGLDFCPSKKERGKAFSFGIRGSQPKSPTGLLNLRA